MTDLQTYSSKIGLFSLKTFSFKTKKCNKTHSKVSFYTFFFTFLLLGAQICNNFSKANQAKLNNSKHTENGNISAKGNLKLYHWNKGNSNFSNKVDDINFILQQFSPDFLSICEANHYIYSKIHFKGYRIEYNHLHINNNIARSVVLIRDTLSYQRRYDLEES